MTQNVAYWEGYMACLKHFGANPYFTKEPGYKLYALGWQDAKKAMTETGVRIKEEKNDK